MSDLMKTGLAWLADQQKAHVSTLVEYRRGPDVLANLAATFGRSQAERLGDEGFSTRSEFVDFIITAADLVLNGQAFLPARGDVIAWTESGVEQRYEVASIGDSHYRPCDPFGQRLRIHTQKILTLP